ncbi:MAG: metallophosphoesterase family protein [Clostridiales bacterium]|nr:metallophosphoesterase family protein [Clostridiales bacterium]
MDKLKFKNGKFRILQLSDMQDTWRTSPDTVNYIHRAIEAVKPDLIVLTGDQVKGYGFNFYFGDNRKKAKITIDNLLKPIVESGTPFTAVFGNHDEFGTATKDFQWRCYGNYGNFIGVDYNFDCIKIFSEDGRDIPFCVYLFDSGSKRKDGSYDIISEEQINRYKNTRDELESRWGHTVKALAFQHIPPVEIYDCLKQVKGHTKGTVRGNRKFSDKFYELPEYAKNKSSFMGENAASPDEKSGQIEAFAEKKDVIGLYFGHDHNNSFTVKCGGLDLGYTQCCGFNIYGPGLNRGGRVLDISESQPEKYGTFTVTYRDAAGRKLKKPVKEFIYTHSPSSVAQAKRAAAKVLFSVAAIAVGTVALKNIVKRKT